MRYWECILDTPAEEIDARCEELAALGVGGFVVENEEDFHHFLETNRQYWDYVDQDLEDQYAGLSRLKFYLTDDEEGLSVLCAVRECYPMLLFRTVEDSDWENNWREYYKPIKVGEKLIVVPQWEAIPDDNRIPLILDPGLIFGTGSHATTKMCLQALEQEAAAGKRVLDLGCGSGILGIGALVLGCNSCCGVDIDPKAPDIACANAALNNIESDRFRVYAGDVLSDSSMIVKLGTDYDIVLANIVADVIMALAPKVHSFMKKDAVFICSGIIDGREKEVRAALNLAGFTIQEHLHDEEWNAFVCR